MKAINVMSQKSMEVQNLISTVTELLYQKKQEEAYKKIDEMLSTLLELSDMVALEKAKGVNILFDEEKLKETLLLALEAMEKGDMIVFSDILQYEIGEQIQEWIPR